MANEVFLAEHQAGPGGGGLFPRTTTQEQIRGIVREEIREAMPEIVAALRADLLKRSRGAGLSRRSAQ